MSSVSIRLGRLGRQGVKWRGTKYETQYIYRSSPCAQDEVVQRLLDANGKLEVEPPGYGNTQGIIYLQSSRKAWKLFVEYGLVDDDLEDPFGMVALFM